jgi:hypothetical protein
MHRRTKYGRTPRDNAGEADRGKLLGVACRNCKVVTPLGILQDKGYKIELSADGIHNRFLRKAARSIHPSPECLAGGPLTEM